MTKRRVPRTKITALEQHVTGMWPKLIRSTRDALEAVQDVKLATGEGTRWPMYVSASEDPRRVRERLRKTLEPAAFRQILRELASFFDNPR